MQKGKSFYIKTFGCKVNQYESQVVREGLLRNGFIESEKCKEADMCIVNTCTVTSTSDSKSLKFIRSVLKEHDKCVIATGCMVENNDIDLSRLSGVKFIIRNKDKCNIPHIIKKILHPLSPAKPHAITGFKARTRAFIKVQDGCNNKCSYCKVRIVRGRSMSRRPGEVIEECGALIRRGTKEIVLSGICLGSYGKDLLKGHCLSWLVRELCGISGDWRLRLSSIEPKDINKDLITQFCKQEKLCKHLHIPFQSGDNSVLKKMDRPYKNKDYLMIINRLRNAIPDVAISTDIMVGFPGETEKSFQNTLNFIQDARPMRIHVFPFSKRKGTKAYTYNSDLENSEIRKRKAMVLRLAEGLSMEFMRKFISKDARVLIEEKNTTEGLLQGYTDRYIKVFIDGPDSLKGGFTVCQLALTNQKVYGILPLHNLHHFPGPPL